MCEAGHHMMAKSMLLTASLISHIYSEVIAEPIAGISVHPHLYALRVLRWLSQHVLSPRQLASGGYHGLIYACILMRGIALRTSLPDNIHKWPHMSQFIMTRLATTRVRGSVRHLKVLENLLKAVPDHDVWYEELAEHLHCI